MHLPGRQLIQTIGGILTPSICFNCNAYISLQSKQNVCQACQLKLHSLERFEELPFAHTALTSCYYLYEFSHVAKKLVYRLKINDALYLLPLLYQMLHRFWQESPLRSNGFTCIVPIPPHSQHFWVKKHHFSERLAQTLGKIAGIPVRQNLKRTISAQKQSSLSRKKRLQNAQFSMVWESGLEAKPESVLLVDDVLTTGATLQAAAQTMQKSGIGRISAVAFCKGIL